MSILKRKKLSRFHDEYWLKRGMSIDDARIQVLAEKAKMSESAKRNKVKRNDWAIEYWTTKGFTETEAMIKIEEKRQRVSCNKTDFYNSLQNRDEYFADIMNSRISYNTLEWWMNKGLTHEEAIIQQSTVSRAKCKWCKEYWLSRGFTEKEAVEKISNEQRHNEQYYIDKYGAVLGLELWNQRNSKIKISGKRTLDYWLSKGFCEDDARRQLFTYQSTCANNQKQCKQYWLNLGFAEDAAIENASVFSRVTSVWCVEYWIDMGHTLAEAKQKVSEYQRENSRKSLLKVRNISSIGELKLFTRVSKQYPDAVSQFRCCIGDKTYFLDIYIPSKNIAIEFFGDYFHMNPLMYNELSLMRGGISYKEIHDNDDIRISNINHVGIDTIIIWESDSVETVNNKLTNILNNETN